MTDMMNFPERWEDFLHDYEFEDARRIYTNGSRLIPSFRVKQMMEHYAPVRHGRWIKENSRKKSYLWICSNCRKIAYFCGRDGKCAYQYCPNCGAIMDNMEV